MNLVVPSVAHLPSFIAALEQGWSPIVAREGLPSVEITCDPSNEPSRKVIESNGGVLVEHFTKPQQFGGKLGLRYRVHFKEVT